MVEEGPGQKDEEVGRGDSLLSKKLVQAALALGIFLALALLVSLGFALRWYLSPQTDLSISQRQDLVQGLASAGQALAVLLTGAAGLLGLYLTRQNTNKQLRQARESTQQQLQQARESQERTEASAQETLRLTEQGQITERFTRAIEQLGATDDRGKKKLEIRLGGIYALERIAWDSPERDYSTVMEVLTAYIRANAAQAPGPSHGASEGLRHRTKPAPKRRKGRSRLLRRSHAVLLLTSKRPWMCLVAHRLPCPRNTVLASIFTKPTSEEQHSSEPTSEEPPSEKPSSKKSSSEEPISEKPTSKKPSSEEPSSK
jgi:type II secretory pathway pseudopilin PulG